MKKIVFSNQKGGVGKTTTSLQLGHYLSTTLKASLAECYKVLLIDVDPQGNLTKSLTDNPGFGLYEALSGSDYEAEEIKPNLYLLSGDTKLALLEKSLIGELDAYRKLRELLEKEEFQAYDFILIDSPPSLGVLTINALTASDYLIIPMNPSLYSMQGTTDLIGTLSKVKKNLNPELSLLGVIINAFDNVPTISRQIRSEIEATFREKVFKTALSKSIKVEEAIASKSSIITSASLGNRKLSKIAEELKAIGEELLNRLNPV